jgi:hypothetical protein
LYYVLEVIRGKFPFDKLKDKILEVKRRYEKAALLIEDASISTGLIQSLREKQVNVVAIPVNRDKQSRVISQIDLFEGGRFYCPRTLRGSTRLSRSCCPFPVVMMIRSTHLLKDWHGGARRGRDRLFSEGQPDWEAEPPINVVNPGHDL